MSKRRIVASILAGLVGLMSLTGCQDTRVDDKIDQMVEEPVKEPVKQEMTWNMKAEPKTLDPQRNSAISAGHVINNTFSGLTRDYGDEIRPELIERFEVSKDQLTYTFYLKESKWSDGSL